MLHLQEMCRKEYMGLSGYGWLALLVVALVNEIVQRYPGIRAQSLVQVPVNLLKLSPLGRLPLLRQVLEALDTPKPSESPPALQPEPPPLPPAA